MAVPNVFNNGTVADADEVNANFTWTGLVPIGAVVAWLKTLTNCPTLDDRFVECNGQTLSDADSPFNGVVIPDLNGSSGSKRFLRGSTTSGITGGSDTKNLQHTHNVTVSVSMGAPNAGEQHGEAGTYTTTNGGSTTQDILPAYYEVVFIIRVK